uniref:Uncharacterized protein n=1 Tax=Anopheles culicifacies TaxID=139723 RepID=A0A182M5Y0_9DIPT
MHLKVPDGMNGRLDEQMLRESSHSSAAYMQSKAMSSHPLYSQTLEQHQALLNQYRYSMAGVSPDHTPKHPNMPHHHAPYGSPPGAPAPMVQRTAAVNIIQHESLPPTGNTKSTEHHHQQSSPHQAQPLAAGHPHHHHHLGKPSPSVSMPDLSSPKGVDSKSEPSSSTRSTPTSGTPVSSIAPATAQMPYLPKHWIWNTSFDTTASNASSSPVQITDVNSDDSSDNHDDLRTSISKKRNPYSIEELLKKPESKKQKIDDRVTITCVSDPSGKTQTDTLLDDKYHYQCSPPVSPSKSCPSPSATPVTAVRCKSSSDYRSSTSPQSAGEDSEGCSIVSAVVRSKLTDNNSENSINIEIFQLLIKCPTILYARSRYFAYELTLDKTARRELTFKNGKFSRMPPTPTSLPLPSVSSSGLSGSLQYRRDFGTSSDGSTADGPGNMIDGLVFGCRYSSVSAIVLGTSAVEAAAAAAAIATGASSSKQPSGISCVISIIWDVIQTANSFSKFGCSTDAMMYASSRNSLLDSEPDISISTLIATGIFTLSPSGIQTPLKTRPNAPIPSTPPRRISASLMMRNFVKFGPTFEGRSGSESSHPASAIVILTASFLFL